MKKSPAGAVLVLVLSKVRRAATLSPPRRRGTAAARNAHALMERLRSNIRYCDMIGIDPPIQLDGYPSEPIDSTEAAAKFIERHDGAFDIEGAHLIDLLRGADTQASADAACQAFRQWAESSGLLSDATADSPP